MPQLWFTAAGESPPKWNQEAEQTRLQGEQRSLGDACGWKKRSQITVTISSFPSFLFYVVITRLWGSKGCFFSLGKNKLIIRHIVSQGKSFKGLPVQCVQLTENFTVILSPFCFSYTKNSPSLSVQGHREMHSLLAAWSSVGDAHSTWLSWFQWHEYKHGDLWEQSANDHGASGNSFLLI